VLLKSVIGTWLTPLRRSATSVCLSVAEGMVALDGRKRNAYRIAMGEMREACAAIEIATRLGLVRELDVRDGDRQDRILRTLVRLARER
jgi:four helix bundle protein